MVRFLVTWVVVAFTVLGLDALLPGITPANTCVLVATAVFVGGANAIMRPALRVASWPIAPFSVLVVSVTGNGILMAIARPVTMAWEYASFWQSVIAAGVVSLVAWVLTIAGENPYKPVI